MPKITFSYRATLPIDADVDSIGWLWVLRTYASGIVPTSTFEHASPPFHLLPLMGKYIEAEGESSKSIDFNDVIVANELKHYEAMHSKVGNNIAKNIQLIVDVFNLNDVESAILTFRAVYRLHKGLETTLDDCVTDRWTENKVNQLLAIALQEPIETIELALSPKSRLIKSGLIYFENGLSTGFGNKLCVMTGIISKINSPAHDVITLFSDVLRQSPSATLSIDNYEHHQHDLSLMIKYLTNAKLQQTIGVNILLHGQPGVGKTELARLIAKELELTSFEVASSSNSDDTEGENGKMHERFRSYQVMQNLLSQIEDSLIIFDEIEDVIPRKGLFESGSSGKKAWLNNLLESNPIPAIWISNHVSQIDPALMRRFDLILEVKNLPINKQVSLLQQSLKAYNVDQRWVGMISENRNLTPAIANKIMKVIEIAGVTKNDSVQTYFDKQLAERDAANGVINQSRYIKPQKFDVALLNTNKDIENILLRFPVLTNAKVLLYGPPGTGKTALAHHIAQISNRPLLQKRSSDLISPWIGETESNLKKMFDEAYASNAILLLDEADSFLQSRGQSRHQWEVSQVNELLTQLESYQGFFVCATNFMEHLDQAALRRFNFKIKFEYLSTTQVTNHFEQVTKQITNNSPNQISDEIKLNLKKLVNLTPADFQIIIDQCRLLDIEPTVNDIAKELKEISETKYDGGSGIGFLH